MPFLHGGPERLGASLRTWAKDVQELQQQRRQRETNRNRALQAGNVKLCFASYTAAGTDSNGDDKDNQDCLATEVLRHPVEKSEPPLVCLAVMDGHGAQGGQAAAAAAAALPATILRGHSQDQEPDQVLSEAFAAAHTALLSTPGLDCSASGCTATVALVVDDSLVVGNAGDCRCLVGRFESPTEVVTYELTNDHTPCLMHEANRVLAAGGRIAAYEMNGRRLGPPRVWARINDSGPGLCITRSLGDTAAKRLGVTHVPELCSMPLTVDDRYLVLVTDGITEFMSSQQVMAKVHEWACVGNPPDEVARRLVLEARAHWKKHCGGDEGKDGGSAIIDDCTAIVAFMVLDAEAEARAQSAAAERRSVAGSERASGLFAGGPLPSAALGAGGGSGRRSSVTAIARRQRASARRREQREQRQRGRHGKQRTWAQWAELQWAAVCAVLPWSLASRSRGKVMTV
ncbi:hypothetical protein HYH02_000146 [Chlamydomonas schloesseri]|uniref:PPM-type phosphatase domain-containing protein n=1 Tax=Chlamydomonas schloesseri TaxID=2026947 RepID=A0A835WLW9_9CHLO|nr:hypothetical protein HYH02_000146 [Chlamydomonas schloesseri]|eukprot:KAG2450042.1 hypothetical protein HYH02_000146 [Chlamydomonas schloesseri]